MLAECVSSSNFMKIDAGVTLHHDPTQSIPFLTPPHKPSQHARPHVENGGGV